MSAPHSCNSTVSVLRWSRRAALAWWGIPAVALGVFAAAAQWLLRGNLQFVAPGGLAALALIAVAICIYLGHRHTDRLGWGIAKCNEIQALKDTGEDPERLARLERLFEEELNRPIGGLFR